MAVELAKLSLWLHSFTVGAPLSFLDHHLRWGNSLIGSDVRTVEAAARREACQQGGRIPSAGQKAAATFVRKCLARCNSASFKGRSPSCSTLTATDYRGGRPRRRHSGRRASECRRVRRHAGQALTPYKQVLDLWVSRILRQRGAAHELLDACTARRMPWPRLRARQLAETYQAQSNGPRRCGPRGASSTGTWSSRGLRGPGAARLGGKSGVRCGDWESAVWRFDWIPAQQRIWVLSIGT